MYISTINCNVDCKINSNGNFLKKTVVLLFYNTVNLMFRSVHVLDRNLGGSPKEIIQGNYVPMDIRVWDPKRQPYKWTPCERNNGGCSHLCLLAPYAPGFTCACPTGIKLVDNFTCANGMLNTFQPP